MRGKVDQKPIHLSTTPTALTHVRVWDKEEATREAEKLVTREGRERKGKGAVAAAGKEEGRGKGDNGDMVVSLRVSMS